MKMINGQLPTWYVIKRISEDPELYAKAPNKGLLEEKIVHEDGVAQQYYYASGIGWCDDGVSLTNRNDWTLYRRGGKKRKATGGEVKLSQVSYSSLEDHQYGYADVTRKLAALVGTYDIIAIPVKE